MTQLWGSNKTRYNWNKEKRPNRKRISKHHIWKTSVSLYAVNLLSYISSVLIYLLSVDCILLIFKSTNKILMLSLQCTTLINHCTYKFLLQVPKEILWLISNVLHLLHQWLFAQLSVSWYLLVIIPCATAELRFDFMIKQTTLPVKEISKSLQQMGYDVMPSDDAGRFVCNYVYYHSLKFAEKHGIRSLFVHFPLFLAIDEEVQMQFVASLLEVLASLNLQ